MATLLKADGSGRVLDEKEFNSFEIKRLIKGDVQVITTPSKNFLYISEHGALLRLSPNRLASNIAGKSIVGDVVMSNKLIPI